MTKTYNARNTDATSLKSSSHKHKTRRKLRRLVIALAWLGALSFLLGAGTIWLGAKAILIKNELAAATELIPPLREDIRNDNVKGAGAKVDELRVRTAAAKDAVDDPMWTLASMIPGLGQNFSAVAEVARSANDVANLGLAPLARVHGSLNWNSLVPNSTGTDLGPLQLAAPDVSSAAYAVRISSERLNGIDATKLLPEVAEPLNRARGQLTEVKGALDAAADASQLLPRMLGAEEPRNYLLMIQNNAEARASGGIPGALAILNLVEGKLTLGSQSSAADVGIMSPNVPTDPEQSAIYSGRLGKFMQDVNLTPDFPTAARTAQAMWERRTGQRVDGVISVDPVALGYILDATGPVEITSPELVMLAKVGLPTELNGNNVVQTLLSDVYSKIEQPKMQDAYFAGVAKEVFSALSSGKSEAKGLIQGITRATQEGRVLVWAAQSSEQTVISKYTFGGSISGPSISPAQFGVYFNDGTGAKMDYYVKRTVQLLKECSRDGYEQTTVRVTSTNTAPADAASSLPAYVTGGGAFGVPAGTVQTNIVTYGPVQANVETAKVDGQKTSFAPYFHSNRPVGVLAVRLAPGESKTVDITFGKIVQHTEPNVVVTPTIQDVKDVILPTGNANCG